MGTPPAGPRSRSADCRGVCGEALHNPVLLLRCPGALGGPGSSRPPPCSLDVGPFPELARVLRPVARFVGTGDLLGQHQCRTEQAEGRRCPRGALGWPPRRATFVAPHPSTSLPGTGGVSGTLSFGPHGRGPPPPASQGLPRPSARRCQQQPGQRRGDLPVRGYHTPGPAAGSCPAAPCALWWPRGRAGPWGTMGHCGGGGPYGPLYDHP